ncbi:hypothetical protein SCANM124S_00273 [Streptomyces canus]
MLAERETARCFTFAIPPSGLQLVLHRHEPTAEHLAGSVDLRDAGV